MNDLAIKERLETMVREAANGLVQSDLAFVLERPGDMGHGDFSTNVAMAGAKRAGKNPRALAEEIVARLAAKQDPSVLAIEIAGPGFINFRLSRDYFVSALEDALKEGERFGRSEVKKGERTIFEYTDPNPFKEFHIGHLLPNTVGESLSRIAEFTGAEVKRVNYQGDVGMHVAKAIWGIMKEQSELGGKAVINLTVASLGAAYARGTKAYEENEQAKKEMIQINKEIYAPGTNTAVDMAYELGRRVSLDYFETIYARLGTKFDRYFFESESAGFGEEIVRKNVPAIFEESDGAIVYRGDESMGLHTRVFINKEGLPTYEAKELGLAKLKYDYYPYDRSVIVTSNEIVDYFKVLIDAMAKVYAKEGFAAKTEHVAHGTLRLLEGKMSSRTGNVITAISLLDEAKAKVLPKIAKERGFSEAAREDIAEKVAVGAVKYSILKQQVGRDMIFDFDQSLSFEGDSGPYLQYSLARARSLLEKADGKQVDPKALHGDEVRPLQKLLLRYPEAVLRAHEEYSPHHIVTYLVELAREWNAFYANTQVLDGAPDEPYKLALATLAQRTLASGLWLLGIPAPARM